MRIAVYGATGMIGSRTVAEAVSRGHEVTAISRSGGVVEGATAQPGDVGDATQVAQVAADHDVLVSATAPNANGGSADDWLVAVRTLIASAGDTRVVYVGGAGSLLLPDGSRLVDSPDFPESFRAPASVLADTLPLFREAPESVDWTYVSPAPVIEPGERTGRYRLGLDEPAGPSISAEDFAVLLVDEIEGGEHRRQRITGATG